MTTPLPRRLAALLRHRWLDAHDTRRALADDAAARLRTRVVASEQRHTGQIRICVESSLPASYLWRHVRHRVPLAALAHQRALMMFSKLRVWDTEANNGVLIYLLLADRTIEILADRSLRRHVAPAQWQAMVQRLAGALHDGRFEDGLSSAIDEVSAVLVADFPPAAGAVPPRNELPDEVVRL